MELTEEDMKKIAIIYKQVGDHIEQVEYYSDRGDIDRAMEVMKQVETLKESARKITNPPEEKKITVCEISGNFMSSRDNDDRMRAHFEVLILPSLSFADDLSDRANNLLDGKWFEINMRNS